MADQDIVCLLEDDPAIERLFVMILQIDGVEPIVCGSPEALVEAAGAKDTGLAIIRVGIPADPPLSLITQVKAHTTTPVLATSASVGEGVARASLEAGADDYQAMPFDPDEFLDRVMFLLGRPQPKAGGRGLFAGMSVRVDPTNRELTINGDRVNLSRTEWDILSALAVRAPEPIFNADLARAAFDRELSKDPEYLKLWIERLQRKLRADPGSPPLLRPFHGIAYSLAVSELPSGEG